MIGILREIGEFFGKVSYGEKKDGGRAKDEEEGQRKEEEWREGEWRKEELREEERRDAENRDGGRGI